MCIGTPFTVEKISPGAGLEPGEYWKREKKKSKAQKHMRLTILSVTCFQLVYYKNPISFSTGLRINVNLDQAYYSLTNVLFYLLPAKAKAFKIDIELI